MSEPSLQDILEPLEINIKELAEEAKFYEKLKNLAKSIPNILKHEQLISNYKKKTLELKELLKTNKMLIKTVKENTLLFSKKVQNKLANFKDISPKPENDEKNIKDVIEEKKLQIFFKEEVCGAVKHIDNLISAQNQLIKSEINSTQQDIIKFKENLDGKDLHEDSKSSANNTITDRTKKKLEKIINKNIESVNEKCVKIAEEKFISLENNYKEIVEGLAPKRA